MKFQVLRMECAPRIVYARSDSRITRERFEAGFTYDKASLRAILKEVSL